MSVLLRHPAAVPALFSRAVGPEPEPVRRTAWGWLAAQGSSHPAGICAALVLIEVPLVKAALAVLGLAPHP